MSRMTGSEFVDMLRDMLGGETEETLSETRLLRWLDQSHLEVVAAVKPSLLDGSETVTTADGTAEYTFTYDNVMEITDAINNTSHQPLYPINEHQYNQFNLGGTQTGSPSYYYNSGADTAGKVKVTLWPTPNAVYSVEFSILKKPAAFYVQAEYEILGGGNTSILPEVWDDSILYRAAARGWVSLGDYTAAKELRGLAMENDRAAYRVTNMLSELGESISSPVGRALRNG